MAVLSSHRSVTGPGRQAGWTAARISSVIIGVLLALCSLGLLGLGGTALWASTTQRHGGDISLGAWNYRSPGYAVVSSTADLFGATGGATSSRSLPPGAGSCERLTAWSTKSRTGFSRRSRRTSAAS